MTARRPLPARLAESLVIGAYVLLFVLLAVAVAHAQIYADFTMPSGSVSCPSTSEPTPALSKKMRLYFLNAERSRWNWNLWIPIYAIDYQAAGSKDGFHYHLLIPQVFYQHGDSAGLWVAVADSAGNWSCNNGTQIRFRVSP
jgi:hypothetical protein